MQESRNIIHRFRQYFSADQRVKLEEYINTREDGVYQGFIQYQKDCDLNGFISEMTRLTQEHSVGKEPKDEIKQILNQLSTQENLNIDEFLLDQIYQKKDTELVRGVFQFYQLTLNKPDLIENLKILSKTIQRSNLSSHYPPDCIFKTIDTLASELSWPHDKVDSFQSHLSGPKIERLY